MIGISSVEWVTLSTLATWERSKQWLARRPDRRTSKQATAQYESELTISPPFVVLSARHVGRLIEFLMNLTVPSPKRLSTPPGCRLLDANVRDVRGVVFVYVPFVHGGLF